MKNIVLILVAIIFFIGGAVVFQQGTKNMKNSTPTVTPNVTPTKMPLGKQEIIGWVASWGQTGIEQSLPQAIPHYKTFSPMLYRVMPDSTLGRHIVPDWDYLIQTARANNVPIEPVITDEGDVESIKKLLNDKTKQDTFIKALITEAKQEKYTGWSVDIEVLSLKEKEPFSAFIKNLSEQLHANKLKLNVIAFGRDDKETYESALAHDYEVFGKYADQVQLMIYYYNNEDTDPGGQTPADWYRSVLTYAEKTIPQDKIVIGLSNYGNEWVEDRDEVEGFTYEEVKERLAQYNLEPTYDAAQLSKVARFDTDGEKHTLYYEDTETILKKMNIAQDEFSLNKFAFWQLTASDPSFWEKL